MAKLPGKLLEYLERNGNTSQHLMMCCFFFFFSRVLPYRDKNCTALWEAFRMVLLRKDPCSVFPSDYDLFINLSRHSIPRDKVKHSSLSLSRERVHGSGVCDPAGACFSLPQKSSSKLTWALWWEGIFVSSGNSGSPACLGRRNCPTSTSLCGNHYDRTLPHLSPALFLQPVLSNFVLSGPKGLNFWVTQKTLNPSIFPEDPSLLLRDLKLLSIQYQFL